MEICKDGHVDIIYEAIKCPVCKLLEKVEEKDRKIKALEIALENLKKTIQKCEYMDENREPYNEKN